MFELISFDFIDAIEAFLFPFMRWHLVSIFIDAIYSKSDCCLYDFFGETLHPLGSCASGRLIRAFLEKWTFEKFSKWKSVFTAWGTYEITSSATQRIFWQLGRISAYSSETTLKYTNGIHPSLVQSLHHAFKKSSQRLWKPDRLEVAISFSSS